MANAGEQIRRNISRNISRATGVRRSTSSSGTSKYSAQKQIQNYRKRLGALGANADAVNDKRNPLEKMLNLEKDQNVLFDIFEILGRPQNALFSGIASVQEGGSFGEGAKEGIKGERKTSGKDLLVNGGMDDTEGKIDLADVLGLGLDIFADPMDLALIPVSGGTSIAAKAGTKGLQVGTKGLKAIDTVSDVARAAKAADKVGDTLKGVKAIDKAADVLKGVKVADNISDTLRTGAKLADTAQQVTRAEKAIKFISPSEGVFRLAGKGAKKVAKIADTGIEKVLGKIDAKQLRNIERVASETGQTTSDIIRQVGGKSDLLGNYKALKKGISNSLDSSKMLGGLVGKTRQSANRADYVEAVAKQMKENAYKTTRNAAEDIAKKTGKNVDDVMKDISKDLTRYIEFQQDTAIDGTKFLKNLSGKANKFEGTKESVNALADALKKYDNIKFRIADDGKSLVINTKKSKYLQAFKDNPEVQKVFGNLKLSKELGYSDKQLKELNEIGKRFGKGGDLENVYQVNKKLYTDIPEFIKKETGVDFTSITSRKGYVKRAKGDLIDDVDNVGPGFARGTTDTKMFGSRKHAGPAEVENIKRQEKIAADMSRTDKNIQSLTNQLSQNKKTLLESQKEAVELKKAEKIKKFNTNIAKIGDKQTNIRASLDNISKMRNEITTKLDDKTIKNIGKIKDEALAASISKTSTDLNNITQEYNSLIKKLSETDLTEKELKSLNKQLDNMTQKMSKAQNRFNTKIDAVNNFVNNRTDMVLKNAHSAITKSEKAAVKEAKLTSQLGETLEKTRQLTQAQSDTITQLDKVIDSLDLQIKGINPENDKKILDKIKRLEDKKVILASQEGKQLFDLDYYAGLDTFINQTTDTIKGVSVYNDALATGTLYNPNYIKFADQVGEEVPRGFTKVNGDVLANQFESVKNFLPENSDALKSLAEDFKGKTLYMDNDFARLMNVTKNSKEQANALVKVVDSFNNMFKKYKVLTPGFQLRNISGNATNMVLSGMPAGKLPEYWGKAKGVLDSSEDILAKVAQGAELTSKEADNLELLKQFYDAGFKDAGTKLQDLEQLRKTVQGKKGPLNKLTEFNAKMNESMDGLNRMALLMYANDNPKYIQKLGKSNAIEAVKYALMDPSNMSDFEKTTMKKIIPFYTFTKQNLLFQASNMMKNTPRYHRLMKALNAVYDNLDENEYNQYQKEGMQIPLPITDSNGNRLFLKTNLPLSDLGEWMSNPLQRTLSSTSPLIRTPYEMVTGKDIFTGKDSYYNSISDAIETTTGKKLDSGTKNITSKAEQILAGLGVDTITTNTLKKVTAALKKHNGDMDSQAMWAEIFRSILQNTNQEKIENSRAYEDLETYQNYIKELKNQGINVPTIKELNGQSKRTLRSVKNRRTSRY